MKLRLLLPLLALPAFATTGFAQNTESAAQLRRDFATVQQQRDSLAEQLAQAKRDAEALLVERDALRAEQEAAKAQLSAAQTSAVEASEAVRAQKEAEMTVDMTVRAYALKEQEAIEAVKAAQAAAEKQLAAEQARDAALAEAAQAAAERDAAKQAEAAALASKAAMQNELYAAQIRIDNLARALSARSGVPFAPAAALAPTPVETGATEPAAEPAAAPRPAPAQVAGPLRTHTVAEGENLSIISFKYYQSPNKWDKIVAANRAKLRNPDMLRAGMVLVIP